VCVSGHRCGAGVFCPIDEGCDEFRNLLADFVASGAHVETEVGGDLLVAAASAVQLISGIADQGDQLLLDKVVNVFSFGVVDELARSYFRRFD
jgi:hypothetical protein